MQTIRVFFQLLMKLRQKKVCFSFKHISSEMIIWFITQNGKLSWEATLAVLEHFLKFLALKQFSWKDFSLWLPGYPFHTPIIWNFVFAHEKLGEF